MAAVSEPLIVAAAQLSARPLTQADETLEAIDAAIAQAGHKRADLLVLPECAYPAYILGSVDTYRSAKHLTGREYVTWLAKRAAQHRINIVSGFVHDETDQLYNAAVVIDERGRVLGSSKKRFLWHADHDWFAPGDDIPVFDTPIGKIGVVICAETRTPEIIATQIAAGAEILAMPTCWVNGTTEPGRFINPQIEFLMEARAREFGVPFVCADKSGIEGTVGYVGHSRIHRADGSIAAEAPPTGDAVIAARIVPRRPYPVWMSATRRERLTSDAPAVRRDGHDARKVTIAALPTVVADERYTGGMGETLFQPLKDQGATLLLVNMAFESTAEQLEMLANAYDIKAVAFPTRTDVFEWGPARAGCVAGQWMNAFPAARTLSLDGAEVLLCFDVPDDLPLLRTRALENRVFLVGVNQRRAYILSPAGELLAQTRRDTPSEAVATVDLNQANDKRVAPRTDVFGERRPGAYRF